MKKEVKELIENNQPLNFSEKVKDVLYEKASLAIENSKERVATEYFKDE
jgi:hypothetical protein